MAQTRAQQNRQIRKDALREQLEQGGHLQHVVDIAQKLSELENKLDALEIQRLKSAAELKLKLINKYLPDIKSIEHTGEDGQPIETNLSVIFKSAN